MSRVLLFEKTQDYSLYRVEDDRFLPDTYIVCNPHSRSIIYSPHKAGMDLQLQMEKNAETLAGIFAKQVLQGAKRQNVCELVFLSGGLYYSLNSGFKSKLGFSLPQCFIGIQRQRIEGRDGEFRAVVGYENFEALPDNAHVIIGDTVASGATLVKGIQLLLDAAETRGTRLESLTVVSLAGSAYGAKKLAQLTKKHIWQQHPGCKVSFFASEMLFHLMPDGTDLRFLMPEAIMPDESRQEAISRYGSYLSQHMKCAVFDWGTRCKNPSAHYKEFLEYVEEELKSPQLDSKGREVLGKMKAETEESMKQFEALI